MRNSLKFYSSSRFLSIAEYKPLSFLSGARLAPISESATSHQHKNERKVNFFAYKATDRFPTSDTARRKYNSIKLYVRFSYNTTVQYHNCNITPHESTF